MKYHNPAAQLPCSYCGKRFVTRTKLSHHLNTHTGDKPFRCPNTGRLNPQRWLGARGIATMSRVSGRTSTVGLLLSYAYRLIPPV